jgi:type IV pilus assembly protein PilN
MIRINLLPFRAARKRENIRRQLTIYALVVLLTLSVVIYYSIQLTVQLNARKDDNTYQDTLKKIAALEKQLKEINTKLDVIKSLEEGKTGPVLLLEQIADAVPENKLWLTKLQESRGSLTLSGTAMDNETVALFMNNLEASEHITTVDLQSSILREIKEYRLSVSDFVLDCKTYAHK